MPSSFFHARGECAQFACACSYLFVHTCTVSAGSVGKQVVVVSSHRKPDTGESQQTAAQLTSLNLLWLTPLMIMTTPVLRQLKPKLRLHFSCQKLLQWIAPRRQAEEELSGGKRLGEGGVPRLFFLVCAVIPCPNLWPFKAWPPSDQFAAYTGSVKGGEGEV